MFSILQMKCPSHKLGSAQPEALMSSPGGWQAQVQLSESHSMYPSRVHRDLTSTHWPPAPYSQVLHVLHRRGHCGTPTAKAASSLELVFQICGSGNLTSLKANSCAWLHAFVVHIPVSDTKSFGVIRIVFSEAQDWLPKASKWVKYYWKIPL